jgi:hypothetical protein
MGLYLTIMALERGLEEQLEDDRRSARRQLRDWDRRFREGHGAVAQNFLDNRDRKSLDSDPHAR